MSVEIPANRRRQVLASKWRQIPSLFWSIVVGVLAVFSVLQTTLLRDWNGRATVGLLLLLFSSALIAAIVFAITHKTPTEKLAMARALYMEALSRFDEKDYEGAESAAERSADLDPEDSAVWNLLGRTKLRRGRLEEAIQAFGSALEVNRHPAWRNRYLHNRAVAYILNRDFGHARNDLDACVAALPHSWNRLKLRALASYYMNDVPAALADAEASVGESPRRVSNQAVLAIVATAAGKRGKATRAAEKARRLRLESPEDYYYLAALVGLSGDRDDALRLLGVSIALDDKIKPRATFEPLWDPLRDDAEFKRLIVRGRHE